MGALAVRRLALIALVAVLVALLLATTVAGDDGDVAPAPVSKPTKAKKTQRPTASPTNPTPAPTPRPTTASPTKSPQPTPAPIDRTFLIQADESFLDFFVDRYSGEYEYADEEQAEEGALPPTFIHEAGSTDKTWKQGVRIPEHLDFVTFNLWHGTRDEVTAYLDEDIKVNVVIEDTKVVSLVRVSLKQSSTTQAVLDFECVSEGSSGVTVVVRRGKGQVIKFKVAKDCLVSSNMGLLVSTQSGELAFHDGKVMPAFNVHDRRGVSFIASKEDQTDSFIFHTYAEGDGFEVVGNPVVRAFAPTQALLSWVAKTSPGLSAAVRAFQALSFENESIEDLEKEVEEEQAVEQESVDGETADEEEEEEAELAAEEEDYGPQDDGEAAKNEAAKLNADGVEDPEAVDGKLHEVTDSEGSTTGSAADSRKGEVCHPKLSGEVAKASKKGSVKIVFKDYDEKKLLGFASAGLLGMRGGRRLAIDYNCIHDGLAIITLELHARKLGPAYKKMAPERIQLSWLKVCSAVRLGGDDSTISLMGFNVHLGMYARDEPAFFPILNGITTEPFLWNTMSVVASPEEVTTSFYVSLRESVEEARFDEDNDQVVRIRKVRLSVQGNRYDTLEPKLSGHGAHGGLVTSESLPLTVHYNCKKTGNVRVGIEMHVDVVDETDSGDLEHDRRRRHLGVGEEDVAGYASAGSESAESESRYSRRRELKLLKVKGRSNVRTVSFYWLKRCSVTPLEGLHASTEDPARFTAIRLPTGAGAGAGADGSLGGPGASPTSFSAVPAIVKGTTSSLFSSADVNADRVKATLYSLDTELTTLAFRLWKSRRYYAGEGDSDHLGIRFQEPVLSSSSTAVEVSLRNVGEMEEVFNLGVADFVRQNGKGAKKLFHMRQRQAKKDREQYLQGLFEVANLNPVFLVVDHVCHNSGSAVVTMQLPIYGFSEKIVTLRWVKHCSYSETNLSAHQAGGVVVFFVVVAVLLTSACFCVALKKQHSRLRYLKSKDKGNFTPMDVVSSI